MKFKTLEVAGIIPALHGMRNPKNSWKYQDTEVDMLAETGVTIGPKDMELAQKLISGGPVHSKFLRQVMVWVNITAPIYWWSEFDTYKVGTVRNSCSTMHKLLHTVRNTDNKDTDKILSLFQADTDAEQDAVLSAFYKIVDVDKDEQLTDIEKLISMKRILPSSYLQTATISLSYENIRAMIKWRHNHRLPEWNSEFMQWVSILPYAKELLLYKNARMEESN